MRIKPFLILLVVSFLALFSPITQAQVPPPGELKVLTIVVNFQDNTAQPFSIGNIQELVFGNDYSLKNYYSQSTNGKIAISGEVAGYFTLPYNSQGNCDWQLWLNAALDAAANAGYNLDNYPKKIVLWPIGLTSCTGNGGAGALNTSWTGIRTDASGAILQISKYTLIHEFGHIIGLSHSNRLDCDEVSLSSPAGCSNIEYGDKSDVMGSTQNWGIPLLNAPHRIQLGGLEEVQIESVASSGIYTLKALYSPESGGTRVISISTPVGILDFSYRTTSENFNSVQAPGVYAHLWNASVAPGPLLLDPHPTQSAFEYYPNISFKYWITEGESFEYSDMGLTVTHLGESNGEISLDIQFGCDNAPSLSSNSPVVYGLAGQLMQIPINGVNNNSSGCAPIDLNIAGVLNGNLYEEGWLISSQPTNIEQLPSGETFSFVGKVKSSLSAQTGPHSYSFVVSSPSLSSSTTFTGTYYVFSTVKGDINQDGALDGGDIGYMLSNWNTADSFADLNVDGIVNGADLGILFNFF